MKYYARLTMLLISVWFSNVSLTQVNNALSGTWFDPASTESLLLVEVLSSQQSIVYWLRYTEADKQEWLVGVGNNVGDSIVVDSLLQLKGGKFSTDLDVADLAVDAVGSMQVSFSGCSNASLEFAVRGLSGAHNVQHVLQLGQANCDGTSDSQPSNIDQSGMWYNASRAGEAFVVQKLSGKQALVAWLSATPTGEPAWFAGIAQSNGKTLHVSQLLSSSKTSANGSPATVTFEILGQLELNLGCQSGTAVFDIARTGFSSGSSAIQRITAPDGLHCVEESFKAVGVKDIEGQWVSEGFGFVADVSATDVSFYQVTESSCLSIASGPIVLLDLSDILINSTGTRVRYSGLDSVTPVTFRRSQSLPARCANGGTGFSSDPVTNFRVFQETIAELYATFEVHGVNWSSQVSQFEAQINSSTSVFQLFSVFEQMLAPLNDFHTSLTSPFRFSSSGSDLAAQDLFTRASNPAISLLIDQAYLGGRVTTAANGVLRYGVISGNIGYLEANSFHDIYPTFSGSRAFSQWQSELDVVFAFFKQAGIRGLIVDTRRNGGGNSRFGIELVSRLSSHATRLAFTERFVMSETPTGYSEPFEQFLEPTAREGFDGNVVLMTSQLTASAAEIFTLTMRSLPQVTTVGGSTLGILSRTERILPNGWTLSLTPGIVETPAGDHYEVTGIPVDIPVSIFPIADLGANRDSALDLAIELLN